MERSALHRPIRQALLWAGLAVGFPEWLWCRWSFRRHAYDAVLRFTDNPRRLRRMPHMAVYRIWAAHDRGRPDLIDATAALLRHRPMANDVRLWITGALTSVGAADRAWEMLSGDPAARGSPRFARQVGLVLRITREPGRRAELRALLDDLSGGGAQIKPAPSGIAFAPAGAGGKPPRPLGRADLLPNPTLPRRHADRLAEEIDRFQRQMAKAQPPAVEEFRNVFTDGDGQIWTETGAVIRTKGVAIPTTARAGVRTLPEAVYAASRTRGIYHWLVDRVPTLSFLLNPDAPKVPILLAEAAPGFEKGTLALAGLDANGVLPVGRAVFVERLLVPRVGFAGLRFYDEVEPIIARLRAVALERARASAVTLPERIYISRRDARRRRLLNELEVEGLARRFGYEPVLFGEIPLWQQIATAASARAILAPHGAGLSHVLFAPRDALLREIVPISDGAYTLRLLYARLSMVLGQPYRAFVENQPTGARDWSVDLPALERFLAEEPAR